MIIENYLNKLSNLRTDSGRHRYPAHTYHHTPDLNHAISDEGPD